MFRNTHTHTCVHTHTCTKQLRKRGHEFEMEVGYMGGFGGAKEKGEIMYYLCDGSVEKRQKQPGLLQFSLSQHLIKRMLKFIFSPNASSASLTHSRKVF